MSNPLLIEKQLEIDTKFKNFVKRVRDIHNLDAKLQGLITFYETTKNDKKIPLINKQLKSISDNLILTKKEYENNRKYWDMLKKEIDFFEKEEMALIKFYPNLKIYNFNDIYKNIGSVI